MPVDILNGYRCVVDQDAYREGQTTKRHRIHGFTESTECDDGGQNREGYGDRNDHGAAPASEKEQNHQCGEARCDYTFAENTLDRCVDENRLVEKFAYFQTVGCGRT